MKYFIDTEFFERPRTISLISMAIVAEDGREYYKWNHHYNASAKEDPWLKENVFPFAPVRHIERNGCRYLNTSEWSASQDFASEILEFIGPDTNPEFWGYYCDYDWVIFCWQFGRMIDLPKHFPMFCLDLKQLIVQAGNPAIAEQAEGAHNALSDALWIKDTYFNLINKDRASCAQESPAEQGEENSNNS